MNFLRTDNRLQAMTVYLRALTAWDIMLLLSSFTFTALQSMLSIFYYYSAYVFAIFALITCLARRLILNIATYSVGISFTSMTASTWMTLLITVARFSAVRNPIMHHTSSTSRIETLYIINRRRSA